MKKKKKMVMPLIKPCNILSLILLAAIILLAMQVNRLHADLETVQKESLIGGEKAKYLEFLIINNDARTVLSDTAIKQKDWNEWNEVFSSTDVVVELYKKFLPDLERNSNLSYLKLVKMREDFYTVNKTEFDSLKTAVYQDREK